MDIVTRPSLINEISDVIEKKVEISEETISEVSGLYICITGSENVILQLKMIPSITKKIWARLSVHSPWL
jgi:hypothetical protein